jgi:hypothetical protein
MLLIERFMRELTLTSLSATFVIVSLLLSVISSGLFHLSPQNVLASKNLEEGEWSKFISLPGVAQVSDSNSISLIKTSAITNSPNTAGNTSNSHMILTNLIVTNSTTLGPGGIKESTNPDRYQHQVIPIVYGNSSRGSFPVLFSQSATNQISTKRIAFVEPTFTYAAYRNGSFYNFYKKYTLTALQAAKKHQQAELTITADLNLLKNRPIPHGPFPYYSAPKAGSYTPYIVYFKILLQHVKQYSPFVTNITDVDVDQGKIFRTDGRNAFDILFLFHDEYATQTEYNNLRQFVGNGGTIVFAFSNLFTTEVAYNKANDSITLVNGHDWKFDGRSAKISVAEKWLDENRNWTGSNFLDIPNSKGVFFRNNPFNYTHTEEQHVTNPNAKILLNYQAYYPSHKDFNATVATYEMNYGKGKVIGLGLWGDRLVNSVRFFDYFDNVIMTIALASNNQVNSKMK